MGERAFKPTEPARRRAARANLLALFGFLGLAALVPMTRAALVGDAGSPLANEMPSSLALTEALLAPLNGLAAWLVWRRVDVSLERKRAGLRRWGWLLLLGALWPAALYGLRSPPLAMTVLIACIAVGCWTTLAFRRLQPGGAVLLLPHLAWLAVVAGMLAIHF